MSVFDPKNWDESAELGKQMVQDLVDYSRTVRERPVWKPVPKNVKSLFSGPMPQEGLGARKVYEQFRKNILPYPTGNQHPRFWGWVMGNGMMSGAYAGFLSNAMNSMVWAGDQAATYVEEQVMGWCKEMLGYPKSTGGLLVSGASMGNFVALAAARNHFYGTQIMDEGVQSLPKRPVIYASTETHLCVQKSWELLGFGSDTMRKIPVTETFQMDLELLERAIRSDLQEGFQPLILVANAGTVNTGAIDPMKKMTEIARKYELWFHVDGAIGAPARMSAQLRDAFAGIEESDSVTFDFHKWLYLPYGVGCVLVRDAAAQKSAFRKSSEYLSATDRGFLSQAMVFGDLGLELSRSFRALKVWMAFQEFGAKAFVSAIDKNREQAQFLEGLIKADPELEILAPVSLNIVVFRYVGELKDEAKIDAVNRILLEELQVRGTAFPSQTSVRGKFGLRVAITNHRSEKEDFELLVSEVKKIGDELASLRKK